MITQKSIVTVNSKPFATDQERWQAVAERDSVADGVFFTRGRQQEFIVDRTVRPGWRVSYGELAEWIGQPKSVRACAANPLAVAIPCRRVVRTDGSLSGYRWGIEHKSQLLQRESEAGFPEDRCEKPN